MATQGPNSPGTMADDATVGTVAWTTPDNAKVSDNVYATAGLDGGSSPTDTNVRIVKSDGTIGTTNKGTSTALPATDAYRSYGASSDLWGETWTSADINDIDFGLVVSYTSSGIVSHYLKATNFGFSIPAGATINGIVAEIEANEDHPGFAYHPAVDHIRITVYYTDAVTGNNLIALGVN